MSEDEEMTVDTTDGQRLTVEYKDGQLQIVEVTPYEHDKTNTILPDVVVPEGSGGQKYMQVLDPEKGLMQLDLLNLTLVRCDDGEESYRLVTNAETDDPNIPEDATVTCVLQSSDGEEQELSSSYVMMEDNSGVVVLQPAEDVQFTAETHSATTSKTHTHTQQKQNQQNVKLSPQELIQKAKALQKAKYIFCHTRIGKRGRRKKSEIPSPHQLLASPDLKLFLYSCKLCTFKCNAIKELAAHRAEVHRGGSSTGAKPRGGASTRQHISLQCARCPFRAHNTTQLMKHLNTEHFKNEPEDKEANKVHLDCKEVDEADVLVCGACGFESGDKSVFRTHIVDEHGATTT